MSLGSRSAAAAKLMKSAFETVLSPEAKGFDRVVSKVVLSQSLPVTRSILFSVQIRPWRHRQVRSEPQDRGGAHQQVRHAARRPQCGHRGHGVNDGLGLARRALPIRRFSGHEFDVHEGRQGG